MRRAQRIGVLEHDVSVRLGPAFASPPDIDVVACGGGVGVAQNSGGARADARSRRYSRYGMMAHRRRG